MQEAKLLDLCRELDERFSPSRQVMKGFERAINAVWLELCSVHDAAYEPALKRLKIETNTLPTVERVRSVFEVEGKKAMLKDSDYRDREWGKTKEDNPRREAGRPEEVSLTAVQIIARDEHARCALQGFAMMQRSDKTHKEKLEFFKLMESRYPGIGWGKEGASWQKGLERKGLL